ncbi:hypothetical protein [Streptomyces virginiae]|uniref:hypothetical protein n=1 Tax=Streptomyces virginiae TaxID=1961 RepID=UPI0036FEAFB6
MRMRNAVGSLALGAVLALGMAAGTAQAAPTTTPSSEAASVPAAAADKVFIGYYPSSTACHIAGTAMAGDKHTCIRYGTRYGLWIFV